MASGSNSIKANTVRVAGNLRWGITCPSLPPYKTRPHIYWVTRVGHHSGCLDSSRFPLFSTTSLLYFTCASWRLNRVTFLLLHLTFISPLYSFPSRGGIFILHIIRRGVASLSLSTDVFILTGHLKLLTTIPVITRILSLLFLLSLLLALSSFIIIIIR